MFSVNEIRTYFGLSPYARDHCITGVSIDSRQCQLGHLFVAIPGSQVDGHNYIDDALSKGASACLISRKIPTHLTHHTQFIEVTDSVKGLGQLAGYWRDQCNLMMIALTGSCGKTTLKALLSSILTHAFSQDICYATPGNYNSSIGVPLSLLQLKKKHQYAILELGMNQFNEIATNVSYVKPYIVAINNVAPCHTQNVGDLTGVAQAKGEIIQGLHSTGIAVLNRDSKFFSYWEQLLGKHQSVISFGEHPQADIRLSSVTTDFNHCHFTLNIAGQKEIIDLPLIGHHNAMNATCATAIAYGLNISLNTIKYGLQQAKPVARRLQRFVGRNNCLLIDDGYNANPNALYVAIDLLRKYHGRKILLFGDMLELGRLEKEYHADIGKYAKKQKIDYIFAIGDLTRWTIKSFGYHGYFFKERSKLVPSLLPLLDKHCCVLVKGSLSMNMAEFIRQLRMTHYPS